MSWSWTLYRYLAIQFLAGIAIVYVALLTLAFSIDIVDLLNRAAGHNVPTATVVGMAVLYLPNLGQQFLPFAVLLGAIFSFARLSRSQELVATRAAGMSAWDFLIPPLSVAMALGIVAVALFTPLSARMYSAYAPLEARYIKGEASQLSQVSQNGLWLRQGNEERQAVIHAVHVADQGRRLNDVLVLLYRAGDKFAGRIDAKSADLGEHVWVLKDAYVSGVDGKPPVHHDSYQLETTLTPDQIQQISTAPEAMSFWRLPGFIRDAQAAGFSVLRYRVYLYTLYALPFLFAAMVFMGASFSLHLSRAGGIARMILFGAACGFGVYFFSRLTMVLGDNGAVPAWLAAPAPAIASILIGMTLLFHQEDG
jgi:lipopolysaccharide export system permease protein